VWRSVPTKRSFSISFQAVPMSSRLTKKSFVRRPGRSVNTPCPAPPWLTPRARRPPTNTVISGAVSRSREARSISSSSVGTLNATCR
jgi:hypothetical protein